eukprot:jgi/Chrpa1/11872/Chrysochromulina_OHIO_Genome00013368-RA
MLGFALYVLAVHQDCPNQADGCTGTAKERSSAAVARARTVRFDQPWDSVREEIVSACGLRVQQSTSHCFNDWNHVDCCAMATGNTHRTNEESKVVGMHRTNFLGTHIVDASLPEHGEGGSWCTCHMSSPDDVCHKQFGARTAFKLTWCKGSRVAALLDDYGNVLASGKPTGLRDDGSDVPAYGGASARRDSWRVLDESRNQSWAERWRASCDQVLQLGTVASSQGQEATSADHDEL